jgi:hypothetical protein
VTIEERLDRLTDRHEALTQSVELMGHRMVEIMEAVAHHDRRLAEIMEGIARLLHVAEIHEHRLDDHDRRISGLES